jgi:serine/threonine-protein kinase
LLVADQLLSVLGAVHAHNIVHRDLKPENVFLTRTGHIKVLDFGIARLSELSTPSSMTQAGLTVGTPAFMAPEQARGLSNEVDAASDLWACSALMFHLLSGKHVHEGRTLNEQLMHAMTRPAARLVSVAPDVAPQIRQIVDRGLTYAKAGRWPNARAMQEAVRRAYEELYGSTTLAAEELAVDPSSAAPPPGIGADTSSGSAVEPGAGPPYARSRVALRTGLRLYQLARARPGPTAAVGAAIVALASLLAFASLRPTAPAEAEVATPDVPPAVSSHTVAAPPPVGVTNHVPEVAATDLPVANDPPEAESASHRAWAPTPAVDTTVDCHPPYVVDAVTGKKQWKLECL